MKRTFLWAVLLALTLVGCSPVSTDGVPDFPWMKEVGAKQFPTSELTFNVTDYGAVGDAVTLCTEAIQQAIDAAEAAGGGTVTFEPGIYLTGSVFVDRHRCLHLHPGHRHRAEPHHGVHL